MRRWLAACGVVLAFAAEPGAQQKPEAVTADRLVAGHKDQSQWLMFGGDYTAQRHSPLTQVTPQNVNRLAHQWTFQTGTLGALETTTLVHDGVLYVTGPNNVAWALDAKTGKSFWRYRRTLPGRPAGLLRTGEPRLRDTGQPAVHDDARRAPDRARRQNRRARLGHRARGL